MINSWSGLIGYVLILIFARGFALLSQWMQIRIIDWKLKNWRAKNGIL